MPDAATTYHLRGLQPGDLGWVVHRHGVLYGAEYGWGARFEALVAQIAGQMILNFDPDRECCWIADAGGRILGSLFLVTQSQNVAKLRLLLVEPEARGLGIATRLVKESIRFAADHGYHRITLWTHRELEAAQRIYRRLGFQLTAEEEHREWGVPVMGQTWELTLASAPHDLS